MEAERLGEITEFKVSTFAPVFGFNLFHYTSELAAARAAIAELRSKYPETTPSSVKAVYMSPWNSHLLTEKFDPLILLMSNFIKKTCVDFYKVDLLQIGYVLRVANCWCTIYEEGNSSVLHHHFPSDFAVVVYLDLDQGASPIVFSNTLQVNPVSATALLFPGFLEHHVPETRGRRIIVAINFIKVPAFDLATKN